MWAPACQHDIVARLHGALGDDPEVEPRSMLRDKKIRHLRNAETHAHTEAGDAGLGDLELGIADPVSVADADVMIGHAGYGEVLSEVAGHQVVAAKVVAPVVVRLGLVDHHRPLLAAVTGEIALAVSVDVEPAHHHGSVDRGLPDSGADRLTVPRHVFRHTDVHGNQ